MVVSGWVEKPQTGQAIVAQRRRQITGGTVFLALVSTDEERMADPLAPANQRPAVTLGWLENEGGSDDVDIACLDLEWAIVRIGFCFRAVVIGASYHVDRAQYPVGASAHTQVLQGA